MPAGMLAGSKVTRLCCHRMCRGLCVSCGRMSPGNFATEFPEHRLPCDVLGPKRSRNILSVLTCRLFVHTAGSRTKPMPAETFTPKASSNVFHILVSSGNLHAYSFIERFVISPFSSGNLHAYSFIECFLISSFSSGNLHACSFIERFCHILFLKRKPSCLELHRPFSPFLKAESFLPDFRQIGLHPALGAPC